MTLVLAAALIVGGSLIGSVVYPAAQTANRRVAELESHGKRATGQVIRVNHRGSGGDSRAVVEYQYTAGGQYTGRTDMRRRDAARLSEGSPVTVRYLPTEPETSWIPGHEPRRRAVWPAFVILPACFAAATVLVALFRRQSSLLSDGRGALARVTQLEKKASEYGTAWRVQYEWRLLSGAKRHGRYMHSGKEPPAVGATIPIVYDRDEPGRHSKYPLKLVAAARNR